MDHKVSFFPTEHLTEDARHAALLRIIREFNDLKSHRFDGDYHKKRQTLLALWGDLVLARHDPADLANPGVESPTEIMDEKTHEAIVRSDEGPHDAKSDPSALEEESVSVPPQEGEEVGSIIASSSHEARVVTSVEDDQAPAPLLTVESAHEESHAQTLIEIADLPEVVAPAPADDHRSKREDHESTEVKIMAASLQTSEPLAPVIQETAEREETRAVIAPVLTDDYDDEKPVLFRLRLLKTGVLNDMVLPAGTIVATNAADAEELIASGTAEKMLIQTETDQ